MKTMTAMCLALFLLLSSVSAQTSSGPVYQLVGKVVPSDSKLFRNITLVVFLHSSLTPFSVRTFTDSDGGFKFKSLRPGLYTLIVAAAMTGEVTRTIEIGPSFADSKGRVFTTVPFERRPQTISHTVSTTRLRIPDGALSEYRKAQDRLARNETARAIVHLKKAVELAPQFSEALNNLGTIAYQSKSYAEAERYFRQALEQEPDSYAPLVNLGGALLSGGKIEESLTQNLLAVKARPDDALAHSQLGQSYFYLGQTDLAETELKKATALDPAHFSYPQLVLAEVYLRKENPGLAIQELEQFLKLHPDSDRAPNIRKVLQQLRGK
jgi:tetratricopeptide (TPR) repeat protein